MTKEKALQIVQGYLDTLLPLDSDDQYVVIEKQILEKPYGWVFLFNSKKFLDSGNIFLSLCGNGPIVVQKDTGKIHQLGSANGLEATIKEFEEAMGWDAA